MTLRNATYGSESAPLPASYSGAQAARAGVQWMVPSFPTRFTFPIARCGCLRVIVVMLRAEKNSALSEHVERAIGSTRKGSRASSTMGL